MSLRPMDLQNLIPKAPEVSRVQHVSDQKPQHYQQQAAAVFLKETDRQPGRVPASPHSHGVRPRQEKTGRHDRESARDGGTGTGGTTGSRTGDGWQGPGRRDDPEGVRGSILDVRV